MTHEDICRIVADLAYVENMKQTNNAMKEPRDCPYYNYEKAIIEGEKQD